MTIAMPDVPEPTRDDTEPDVLPLHVPQAPQFVRVRADMTTVFNDVLVRKGDVLPVLMVHDDGYYDLQTPHGSIALRCDEVDEIQTEDAK